MFILYSVPYRKIIRNPGRAAGQAFRRTGVGKTFTNNPYGDQFFRFVENLADSKWNEMTHSQFHRYVGSLRDATTKFIDRTGGDSGVFPNSSDSYICPAYNEVTYKHTVSSTVQSPVANTKIYYSKFQVGVPTTKNLYYFAKNRLTDKKLLVDSERDYLSTTKRQSLTCSFGFNQKSYNFFLNDTFMSLADYKYLFKNYKDSFKDKLATKNIYGNIFYEHLNFRFKSEVDYYTLRLRLHLVKITNPSVSVMDLMRNTFNDKTKPDPESKYSVPSDRQLSSNISTHERLRSEINTDLKCSLLSSIYFKDNAKIIKTFKRNLAPNDIWNFNYWLHYGPGILLNRVFEEGDDKNYRFPYSSSGHPAGFFFILESKGDPRASITRNADNCNFDGSGPGRFTLNFSKSLKFVREIDSTNGLMTIREFINNDEDFEDPELANYFTPDRGDRINVPIEQLNVDRIVNNDFKYQVRYGEGRLGLYLDPLLQHFLSEQDKKSDTENGNENPSPTPTPTVMDPTYEFPTNESGTGMPESSGLRGDNTHQENVEE